MKIKISIILPVYNAQKTLDQCISSILRQQIKEKFELIVINDNSKDNSERIIERYSKKIKYLKNNKNMGAYGSRNRGIATAKGKILVFIDSDCIPKKNWLFEITKPILIQRELVVQGSSSGEIKEALQKIIQESDESYKKSITLGNYCNRLDTRNCAIDKEVFDSIGNFNEKFRRSGDAELGLRIIEGGYKIRYHPLAEVKHVHRSQLKAQLKIIFYHGLMYPYLIRTKKKVMLKTDKIRLGLGFSLLALILMLPYLIIQHTLGLVLILIGLILLGLFKKYYFEPYGLVYYRIVYHSLSTIFWDLGFITSYLGLIKWEKMKE